MAASSTITVRSPQNVYSYLPRNLAIAYGLGVTVTVFIVVFLIELRIFKKKLFQHEYTLLTE